MIELAYFYLSQLENILPPLGVAGKKWPFFHFLLEKSTLPPMMLWKRGATAYLLLFTVNLPNPRVREGTRHGSGFPTPKFPRK